MPVKFSSLTTKPIAEVSKVVGLKSDASSETEYSNCLVDVSDFAKQSKLTEVDSNAVHIYNSETIQGDKTFNGIIKANNDTSKTKVTNSTSETTIPSMGWVNNPSYSTNVVHRTGNETISGNKTFNNNVTIVNRRYISLFNSYSINGEAPSSDLYSGTYTIDKDSNPIGSIFTRIDTQNRATAALWLRNPADPTTGSQISLAYTHDGTLTTYAPHPVDGANNNTIATTYWVNRNSSRNLRECNVVIENYVNGASWYRIWSDGWIEQGTTVLLNNGDAWTFLKPFSDTNYSILSSPYQAPTSVPSDHNWIAYPLLKSSNKCTFKLWDSDGNTYRNGYVIIHAMGY